MHPALQAKLVQTVGHAPCVGHDAYSAPLFGAVASVPTWISYRTQRVVNQQGQEVLSRATLYFDGLMTIGIEDQLVLPDGTSPRIQRVEQHLDPRTAAGHHTTVFL